MPQLLLAVLAVLAASLCLTPNALARDDRPTAFVWEISDPWTQAPGEASALLRDAGFRVEPLPLDRSPRGLRGLIVLGSFVSEADGYRAYMRSYAEDLYNFVDEGNILLQMTQADQREARPPFFPTTQTAVRNDLDAEAVRVMAPDNHLLEGIPVTDGFLAARAPRLTWETFSEQAGFEVILSVEEGWGRPVLMEGAYGQGRFILCSIPWDKPAGDGSHGLVDEARLPIARTLAQNLHRHTLAVLRRSAPAVEPSPASAVAFAPAEWRLAVLPDTQVYSLNHPGVFSLQTDWIRRNARSMSFEYVLHLGDLVNNNTDREWDRAATALNELNDAVPYAVVPGNHDYGPSGDASTRDTLMNNYLDIEHCFRMPTFGGAMQDRKLDNTYHLFEAGGREWIVIALEWGPRDSTIDWANEVMAAHPGRSGILITHAYMNNNDFRYDINDQQRPQAYNPHHYSTPGGVNDGEELWNKLVRKHRFELVFNGHVLGDGTGYRVDTTDLGNACHQMLSNFQMRTLGGEAYMRVLEFMADGHTVHVRSYSPLHDRFLTTPDQNFTINLSPRE